MSYTMLNENEIIDVLVQYLRLKGLRIIQAKNTGETGIDIIAEGERVRYFIEAVGFPNLRPLKLELPTN